MTTPPPIKKNDDLDSNPEWITPAEYKRRQAAAAKKRLIPEDGMYNALQTFVFLGVACVPFCLVVGGITTPMAAGIMLVLSLSLVFASLLGIISIKLSHIYARLQDLVEK